jgi:dTDP-4-dehydrorhamnose reductase
MIVGRGLLGKALVNIDSDKYLYYVNGISNSGLAIIPDDNFESKEIEQIANTISDLTFIYFSTSQVNSVVNHTRPYVKHKYGVECMIAEKFPKYLIVRTSNLVGDNPWNNTTLFNYLYNSLQAKKEITVDESVIRNVLDIDHLITFLRFYLDTMYEENATIDLVNPMSYTMAEMLKEFEIYFSDKFIKRYSAQNSFARFEASTLLSEFLVNECSINLDNYVSSLLKKYYTTQ